MAKTTIPSTPAPAPSTHVRVEFGSWVNFILPSEDAARLFDVMKRAYQVDMDYIGGFCIYTPKDAGIRIEWLKATDVHIPYGTPARTIKEYARALKATAELQGEDFTPQALPFAEWLAAQSETTHG